MVSYKVLFRVAVISLVCAVAGPAAVGGIVLITLNNMSVGPLPDPKPPAFGQVSRVFDVNGAEIAQFREFEQNLPVQQSDIPLVLKQAVVAAEDKSFYSHKGLSLRGIMRALKTDAQEGEIRQGGSTITQQYVKNAYTDKERTFDRKVREAILASRLDRKVDKDEILFKYLSSIYLGEGAYGVGAASETYFRKPVSQLTLSEAATLAGLIPAPSRYEPRGNISLAEQKRVSVLDRMLAVGYIDAKQHQEAVAQRLRLASKVAPNRPVTLFYPSEQAVSRYPYFVDYLRRHLISRFGEETVFRGGLEIRTTIDPKMQADAEAAVRKSLEGLEPPIEMALVSVEPQTGYVKAMVGGRDFSAEDGQVNLALGRCARPAADIMRKVDVGASCWDDGAVVVEGGGTGRQPGSAWKPFVLAAALKKGIPDTKVYRAPSEYRIPNCTGEKGCVIENFEGSAGGNATLRRATERSYNTVYAQVILDVGVPEVAEMARSLGITSAWVANPEVHGPSYALGAQEVSPLDMASAYGTFATLGRRAEATPVLWVRKPDGKFLVDNRKPEVKRVVDEHIAYNVTDILKGVITQGTGTRADIGRPAAGKTGTAQEFRDAWFVGYTPTLSTSVWIGDRSKPTPLRNIKGLERVTGGSIPAETWKAFMSEALKDVPVTDFDVPPPPTTLPPPPTSYDPNTTRPTTATTTAEPASTETTKFTLPPFATATTALPTTTTRGGLLPTPTRPSTTTSTATTLPQYTTTTYYAPTYDTIATTTTSVPPPP